MSISQSPFTLAQVQLLNERQCHVESVGPFGLFHPFTCPDRSNPGHGDEAGDRGVLIATESGWICPYCGYTQDYAYTAMVTPSTPLPPEAMEALNKIANADELQARLLANIDQVIAAYDALRKTRKLSWDQSEEENLASKRIWDNAQVMLQCLYRRRLALKGVEVRPGRDFSIDPSWIPRTGKLPPVGRHVEVLCHDPRIGNPAHPGCGHGYTVHVSQIPADGSLNSFWCELTGDGLVTHWRELPEDVRATSEKAEMMESAPYLHIYGQRAWHDDAWIVGNRAALQDLRQALDAALSQFSATDDKHRHQADVFAVDGEGYRIKVCLLSGMDMEKMAAPYSAEEARDGREEVIYPDDLSVWPI